MCSPGLHSPECLAALRPGKKLFRQRGALDDENSFGVIPYTA
jgi:hypothetical protein